MGSPRGPFGHVLVGLSGHERASGFVAAELGDVHDVQHRVDLAVAADVKSMAAGPAVALPLGDGQRGGTAPAGDVSRPSR